MRELGTWRSEIQASAVKFLRYIKREEERGHTQRIRSVAGSVTPKRVLGSVFLRAPERHGEYGSNSLTGTGDITALKEGDEEEKENCYKKNNVC